MKKNVLKRLLYYTKPYIGYLIFALFCAVVSVTLTLLAPVLIGNAIDYIIGKGNVNFPIILKFLIT